MKMNYKDIELHVGDFRDLLPIKDVQTFIIDPPYNVNYNYHRENDKQRYKANSSDNLSDQEYKQFYADLLDKTYESSKDDASLFLINTPLNTFEQYETVKNSKWLYNQTIHWVYPNNMGRTNYRFTPSTRYITWLVKDLKNYKRYIERLYQPYKEDSKKTRAQKAKGRYGANLYDWWHINIVKNVSSEKVKYVNQLPRELLDKLIITTTDYGDLVADANCGTASAMLASHRLGRASWGCDINDELFKLWVDQLEKLEISETEVLYNCHSHLSTTDMDDVDLEVLINVGTGIKDVG
jgi:DNA modification methylase